jgi:hypothetical protein
MKKVLQAMSKYIFAAFGIAVLALLMSLTYSALTRIFPDSLVNRMWGLVMFDIAAMCWAIAFVFSSGTTGQYATSAIGFVVGFVGTLGMVAAEVMLSSGQIESADIGQWMVYGFIIVTALHAALLYAFHAASGEIHGQIEVGIARGEIVTEARREATRQLDESKRELAHNITQGIVSQVKRDLDLYPVDGTPFAPKKAETAALPHITETEKEKPGDKPAPFRDSQSDNGTNPNEAD